MPHVLNVVIFLSFFRFDEIFKIIKADFVFSLIFISNSIGTCILQLNDQNVIN